MVTAEQVREELKKVPDPELGLNIVDLGLVYNIEIQEKGKVHPHTNPYDEHEHNIQSAAGVHSRSQTANAGKREKIGVGVKILMTMTFPGCPLAPYFEKEVPAAARRVVGVKDVELEITFEPPWKPTMVTEEAKEELRMR